MPAISWMTRVARTDEPRTEGRAAPIGQFKGGGGWTVPHHIAANASPSPPDRNIMPPQNKNKLKQRRAPFVTSRVAPDLAMACLRSLRW